LRIAVWTGVTRDTGPIPVIRSGAGWQATEPQLCLRIVSAHFAIMRLPAISIFES
jgi:hypothetical protein